MYGMYRGIAIAGAVLAALFGAVGGRAQEPAVLSVLTYNVEGLPWPVRVGRAAAMTRITQQLRAMRTAGRQPHIVVLEEAFSTEAKAIAAQAGYRYIADGPTARATGTKPVSVGDKAFAAAASFLSGETWGKWSGSGIRVASDFPILNVRRMVYPAFACAGLDCLANKGALMVTVAIPGAPQPVAIVATHLNSRRAARVAYDRSFYAFRRQLDTLSNFVRSNVPRTMPFIVVGDFNAGQEPRRRIYLLRQVTGWRSTLAVRSALSTCLREGAQCPTVDRGDLLWSWQRGRDWQIFAPSSSEKLMLKSMMALFGHDRDGRMLSDHVGYAATYFVGS